MLTFPVFKKTNIPNLLGTFIPQSLQIWHLHIPADWKCPQHLSSPLSSSIFYRMRLCWPPMPIKLVPPAFPLPDLWLIYFFCLQPSKMWAKWISKLKRKFRIIYFCQLYPELSVIKHQYPNFHLLFLSIILTSSYLCRHLCHSFSVYLSQPKSLLNFPLTLVQ